MTGTNARAGGRDGLGRDAGRTDDAALLRVRLPDAPAAYVEGALENPALGPPEVELLLRARHATPDMLAAIAGNKVWMAPRSAKRAFVANPRAPLALARAFLPHLFWRQLAELAADARLSITLRRAAERVVHSRLPELASGERIALARIASRGLIEALRDDTDTRVLESLAQNPKASESDIARIVARSDAPAQFLDWLARESSWSRSRTIGFALVRHGRLPAPAALQIVSHLPAEDLEALRDDPETPRLVRIAAERRATTPGSPAAADVG